MGASPATRAINESQLPTELQEGSEHAKDRFQALLVWVPWFLLPQEGEVHSTWRNNDSIKEKEHSRATPRQPLQGYVSYIKITIVLVLVMKQH